MGLGKNTLCALAFLAGAPACGEESPKSFFVENPGLRCAPDSGLSHSADRTPNGTIILRCREETQTQAATVIKADSVDTTDSLPDTVKAPEETSKLESLSSIISGYEKVLGPGHDKQGFYYLDFSTFRIYGPYIPDTWDGLDKTAKDNYHDENRVQIQENDDAATVDTEADLPIPLAFGHDGYKYENVVKNLNLAYEGTTLYKFVEKNLNEEYEKSSLAEVFGAEDGELFKQLLLKGLIAVESGWRTGVLSESGAEGILQITPSSQKTLEEKKAIPKSLNRRDPADAVKVALALFRYHIDYLKGKVGADHFIFEAQNRRSIFIPLLITSYNAGQGRLLKLVKYLDALHSEGKIPADFYENKEKAIFNEEIMPWLFSRTFMSIMAPKDLGSTDEDFAIQNKEMREDGHQYYFKIVTLTKLLGKDGHIEASDPYAVFDQLKAAKKGELIFPDIAIPNNSKIKRFINHDSSQSQKTIRKRVMADKNLFEKMRFPVAKTMEDLIAYLNDNPDKFFWAEKEDAKYLAFDHDQIPQADRRVIRKSQLPILQELYLDLNQILIEAGMPPDYFCVPIINSTARSEVNNDGQKSSSPTSFHLSLNAIDLNQYKFRAFRKTEEGWIYEDIKMPASLLNALQEALYENAQKGHLAARFHAGHGHVVLLPEPLKPKADIEEESRYIVIDIGHRKLIDALLEEGVLVPGFNYKKIHNKNYKRRFEHSEKYRTWVRAIKEVDSGNPRKDYKSGDTIKVDKRHLTH